MRALRELLEIGETSGPVELRIQALSVIVKRCVPQILEAHEASFLERLTDDQPTLGDLRKVAGAANNGV